MMNTPRSIQQKILVDVALVFVAAWLLILVSPPGIASAGREVPSVFLGLYLIYWGVLFLLSYFFPDASYVLRALIWICENFSSPRSRYMAFFYFGLLILVGGGALLAAFGFLR